MFLFGIPNGGLDVDRSHSNIVRVSLVTFEAAWINWSGRLLNELFIDTLVKKQATLLARPARFYTNILTGFSRNLPMLA